jgi:hypothetical protein
MKIRFANREIAERGNIDIVKQLQGLPASYPMGTEALSPGVKRQVREADHLPPTNIEIKKAWFYTSTPPYVFMA